jgi:16S rRNA (uracil1498-N3)-methyltransferase
VTVATPGTEAGAGPERAFASPLPDAGLVALSAEEGRHLVASRRVAAGDEVVLFDGEGRLRRGRLVDARPAAATVEVAGPYPARDPSREVVVAVALPAAGRADDLVASLAELGVAGLVPLRAERSAPGTLDLPARRAERWRRLAREALKVNGASRSLRVEAPRTVADVAAAGPGRGRRAVLLDTDPRLPRLSEAAAGSEPVLLVVGPEGGFTDAERATFAAAGVRSASLGACSLKTETAAVAAAAVVLAL